MAFPSYQTRRQMTERQAPAIVGKATSRVHPADADAYKAILARMAADGSRQAGCLFLNATQDAGDPTTFYLFEGWDGYESVMAFHATPGFKTAAEDASALRVTDRFGEVYDVTGVEDMTMPS
jgi:quinol monooxygenase YgiN